MTKQDFINRLTLKLQEGFTTAEIMDRIRYYEGYFDAETGKGKTEEQVSEELGDPVLIARNILEAPRAEGFDSGYSYGEGMQASASRDYGETVRREEASDSASGRYEGTGEKEKPFAESFAREFGSFRGRAGQPEVEENRPVKKGIFRMADGSVNWGCLAGLLGGLALLILAAVVSVKLLIAFWPILLILVLLRLIFRRKQ